MSAFDSYAQLPPADPAPRFGPYPLSDHYDGRRFYNANPQVNTPKGLSMILKWRLTTKRVALPLPLPPDNEVARFSQAQPVPSVTTTFINHATELIEFDQLNLLTDPVFSRRASPLTWLGPRRVREPGITLAKLPPIQVILLSHNHYDHLDLESLRFLAQRDQGSIYVPLGVGRVVAPLPFRQIVELDWWQGVDVNDHCRITFVPAQHWSARGLNDRYQSLWGGYVIEAGNFKIYFAGDTGYCAHFKEIRRRFGPMDLSFLPIGAYEPRWMMKDNHMNPAEAVQAHLDLVSKLSLGMHFGTFQLGDEGVNQAPSALKMAMSDRQVDPETFIAPRNGHTHCVRR